MTTSDRPGAPSALREAILAGDPLRARRALSDLPDDGADGGGPGDQDGALEELARIAAEDGPGLPLAVELLIERLDGSGIVRRFAHAALLDQTAVDDVAQDALISIAGSIGSFGGASKFTTWVHRIVRNRVVDHLRRQRATAPLPPDDLGPAERMSSMIATRATVRDALAALPDHYRAPVTLRDLDGLTYEEIAEHLGRSLGTVKAQISRGRALVAAALREPGTVSDAR